MSRTKRTASIYHQPGSKYDMTLLGLVATGDYWYQYTMDDFIDPRCSRQNGRDGKPRSYLYSRFNVGCVERSDFRGIPARKFYKRRYSKGRRKHLWKEMLDQLND